MKKIQKRLLGILLACVMICLPVSQALAAVSYDSSAGVSGQVLFPGDSLINIGVPVFMDGAEVALETPGTWTNTEEGKVFTATTAEDFSSVSLTAAGYVLIVESGTSEKNEEGADNSENHYDYPPEEEPEVPQDKAFYQAGETVKIKAAQPNEGMVFAGWVTEDEGVSIADPASPETTMTMMEKKVTVTATYQEAVQEPAEGTGEGQMPAEGTGEEQIPAEGTGEGQIPAEGTDVSEIPAEGTGEEQIPAEGTGEGQIPAEGTDVIEIPEEGTGAAEVPTDNTVVIDPPAEEQGPTLYNVTVNDGIGGGSFAQDTWVTVTANDRTGEGYEFTGWFVDSLNASLENPSSAVTGFTMPAGDVTVSAQYQAVQQEAPTYDVVVENGLGSGEYAAGDTVVLQAQPQEGQVFESWHTDNENVAISDPTQAEASFIMPEEGVVVTAEYGDPEPTKYTVTLVSASIKDSIETAFKAAASITVVANTPDTGKQFSGWTVTDGSGNPVTVTTVSELEGSFTMPAANVTVTANYTDIDYPVTVVNGTITATGAAAGTFKYGQTFEIAAADRAAENKKFAGWTAADASGNPVEGIFNDAAAATATVTMVASGLTITANYADIPVTYPVTVANGLINGAAESMTVGKGETITLTANPNPAGQSFGGWSITDASGTAVDPASLGVDSRSATIAVTVNQALNFRAQYDGIQYTITVKDGSANYATAVSGTVVTVTANKAPKGMVFDYWTVNTGNVSLANAYSDTTTFTMPMADVSLTATYREAEYSLTVKHGSSDSDYYSLNETATISSNYPESGKEFAGWEAVSGNVTFKDASRWQTTLKMPASDVTVRATYKDGPSVYDNLILDIVEGGEYYTDDTIKFTASGAGMDNSNPNPGDYRYRPYGYQIGNVTGTWKDSPYTTSMAIKATGEYTLKVTFNKEVYDGTSWNQDGTSDTRAVTFRVITRAAGVATGDSTQLLLVASIAVVSCLLVIILLVIFIRRRRRRR